MIDLAVCTDIRSADEELNTQLSFVINVPGRSYYLQGDNAQESNMWMTAMGSILQVLCPGPPLSLSLSLSISLSLSLSLSSWYFNLSLPVPVDAG